MKPTPPVARACAMLLCQLTLLLFACGHDEKAVGDEPAATRVESAAQAQLPLPPPGEVTLELSGDTLMLLANQAPRRAVLGKLRLARDFELVLVEPGAARGAVTLRLVGASVEEALVATLSGVAFSLRYAPFNELSLVDQVTVGNVQSVGAAGQPTRAQKAKQTRRQEFRRKLARSQEAQLREQAELSDQEREQQRAQATAELEHGLASPDARTRASAVAQLDEARFADLVDRLQNDRSPEVRVAAAEALSNVNATRAGTSALLEALGDPDPQVVIAALDSLQWVDDPSVLPEVREVLDHPNADVREAASETVSWLEPGS